MCRHGQNPLFLEDLVPCLYAYRGIGKDGKAIEAPEIPEEREAESPLTISLPRLRPGVRAAKSLCIALVQPPESRFSASPGLSDIDHIRRYARAVISMEKEFDFSPGPYRLDTLSPPVLVPEVVDKVACRYSRLPLERADAFHATHIEQEIAQLDIIVSQAANRASALKAALARATKQKSKYKEQLELIRTIKANNIMMEKKIKAEQQDLERMKANPDQTTDPPAQQVSQCTTPRPSDAPNATPSAEEKTVDLDAEGAQIDLDVEVALIEATLSRE